jgi:sulfur carrier protein
MKLELNGQSYESTGASSVRDLLRELGRDGVPCAVEVNRTLVPRSRHESHQLQDGDRVEVVTLVGGG